MALKTAIIALLIFLGLLFFAKSSQAASYYVKNGGNDNAAGTSDATAWARVPGMAGWSGSVSLQSGDIVYFRSQDNWSGSGGDRFLRTVAGVTYDGSSWGTGTRAKITAAGRFVCEVVTIQSSNTVFRGFEIDGNRQNNSGLMVNSCDPSADVIDVTVENNIIHDVGGSDNYYYALGVEPHSGRKATNIYFLNNKVYNTAHEGILLYPSHDGTASKVINAVVRGNEVYNTGVYNNTGFGDGILIKDDVQGAIVEYNYLHDNFQGIQFETANTALVGPTDITIRYNISANNTQFGIYFLNDAGYRITANIYGNILINNGESGASYGGGIQWVSHNFSTSVFKVYNNTIFSNNNLASNRYGIQVSSGASGSPTFEFKNNIVYTSDHVPLYDGKNWLSASHSNNIYYRSGGGTLVQTSDSSYSSSNLTSYESSGFSTNPTFKNISNLPTGFTGTYGSSMIPNTDGLSISSGNAIDRGVTLASPFNGAINLSGKGQTRSGSFDIGAYEYVSSSPPPDTTPPAAPTNIRIS